MKRQPFKPLFDGSGGKVLAAALLKRRATKVHARLAFGYQFAITLAISSALAH
jgi:hypothetical protein